MIVLGNQYPKFTVLLFIGNWQLGIILAEKSSEGANIDIVYHPLTIYVNCLILLVGCISGLQSLIPFIYIDNAALSVPIYTVGLKIVFGFACLSVDAILKRAELGPRFRQLRGRVLHPNKLY
jgi:hypothetical protein